MNYNIFLDDRRKPKDCRDYAGDESIYDTEKFVEISNFDDFCKCIRERGVPKFVSFDYDLGYGGNGLICAEFLKFECDELGLKVPEYRVHSAWPGIYSEFKKILG